MIKNENPEYLICKKCGTYIRIVSKRKDGTYYYFPILPFCPNCESTDMKEIPQEKYHALNGVWIRVNKRYGKKIFSFSLKFKEEKNAE